MLGTYGGRMGSCRLAYYSLAWICNKLYCDLGDFNRIGAIYGLTPAFIFSAFTAGLEQSKHIIPCLGVAIIFKIIVNGIKLARFKSWNFTLS